MYLVKVTGFKIILKFFKFLKFVKNVKVNVVMWQHNVWCVYVRSL